MITDIILNNYPINENFKWRTNPGKFLFPKDMDTMHLMNTLKMIWNNFTIYEKIEPVNLYDFSPYYTDEYICETIVHLLYELKQRKNQLNENQIKILQQMNKELNKLKELE